MRRANKGVHEQGKNQRKGAEGPKEKNQNHTSPTGGATEQPGATGMRTGGDEDMPPDAERAQREATKWRAPGIGGGRREGAGGGPHGLPGGPQK